MPKSKIMLLQYEANLRKLIIDKAKDFQSANDLMKSSILEVARGGKLALLDFETMISVYRSGSEALYVLKFYNTNFQNDGMKNLEKHIEGIVTGTQRNLIGLLKLLLEGK